VQDEPARRRNPVRALPGLASVVVILAATAAFFLPVLRGGMFSVAPVHQRTHYPWTAIPGDGVLWPQSDQIDLSLGWSHLSQDAYADGEFPFWQTSTFGGYDLFTNGSAGLAYPPRMLSLWLFEPNTAHEVFSAFHVAAAGLAMLALGRRLRLGRPAATLGGLAWMLSAWNLGWLHLEVVAAMPVLLPLGLLTVREAVLGRSWRWTAAAALTLGVLFVAGHLLLLSLVGLAMAAYAGCLALGRAWPDLSARRLRLVAGDAGRLLAMGAFGAGLAAFLLVPTAAALGATIRAPFSYENLQAISLGEWSTLRYLLWPEPIVRNVNTMEFDLHRLVFVGTPTLLLALVGATGLRRPGGWLGRAAVVVSVLVVMGTPLTRLAYAVLPGFDILRPYTRLLFFTCFGVALLGAIGFQIVLDAVGRWRPARGRVLPALATLTLVALVPAVVTAQLIWYGRRVNPPMTFDRDSFALFRDTGFLRALHRRLDGEWPGRMISVDLPVGDQRYGLRVLPLGTAPIAGVDTLTGYDSTLDRRVIAMVRTLAGEDPAVAATEGVAAAYGAVFDADSMRLPLAERMGADTVAASPRFTGGPERYPAGWEDTGATQIYDGPDGRIFALPNADRGPYLVGGERLVDGEVAALQTFADPDHPYRRAVVVEPAELERHDLAPLPGDAGDGGVVLRAGRSTNAAEIRVDSDAARWLVIPESYSSGWTATLNGEEVPVVRVNYNQRGIRVPAGTSTIELRYLPPGFRSGAALSALSAAALLALAITGGRRSRRGAPTSLPGTAPAATPAAAASGVASAPDGAGPEPEASRPASGATPPVGSGISRPPP
jgi:hypothetical protein